MKRRTVCLILLLVMLVTSCAENGNGDLASVFTTDGKTEVSETTEYIPSTETETETEEITDEPATETESDTETDTEPYITETLPPDTESDSEETTAEPETTDTPETEPVLKFEGIAVKYLPNVTAKKAFVYSETLGLIGSKGDMDERLYPASISKLYTICVALRYVTPETLTTVGTEIDALEKDSSVAHLEKGQTLTVEDVIAGMMLPSGNDAAFVLAATAGRVILDDPDADGVTAWKKFIETLNAGTGADGLTDTHFVRPDGYHNDDHYTTMNDLLKISKMALECDIIIKYSSMQSYYCEAIDRTWYNSNYVVRQDSKYYCAEFFGLKTGYTGYAGPCLISVAKYRGDVVIIGVFDSDAGNKRFTDTVSILKGVKKYLNKVLPEPETTESESESVTDTITETDTTVDTTGIPETSATDTTESIPETTEPPVTETNPPETDGPQTETDPITTETESETDTETVP